MTVVVAVLAATAAAWWPGRAVARVPVTRALSARPPRPKPAHHSAIVAAVLIVAGIVALVLSGRSTLPLIVAGILATILGTLLLGPLAIRLFARAAGRAPIAVRLALRDLARYQARSGAALAAITLALGIAATIVILAAAEEKKSAAQPPNLSSRQIRVYTGAVKDGAIPVQTPAELDRMAARVRQLAADLDDAAVIPLRSAFQPGEPSQSLRGCPRPFLDSPFAASRHPNSRPSKGSSTSPRLPCSGTSESTARRSIRARTSWPIRACRPTSSSFPSSSRRGGTNTMCCRSRTSRESTAGSTSAGTPTVSCRPRSSRSTVFAATAGDRFRPGGSSSRVGL